MPFFANTRFAETITYIQNYAASGLSAPIRNDIATLINTRINRTTPQARTRYDQITESMSVKRHIAPLVARGTSPEREQRRAIVLLWAVLGSSQNEPAKTNDRMNRGMSLATGALPAALAEVMKLAGVVASPAGAANVFNGELSANPLAFIQNYRIFIYGSGSGSAKFSTAPTGNYQNVLRFHFQYNAAEDRFDFQTMAQAPHGASHAFDAVSVPAIHWSDVPGRGVNPAPTAMAPSGFAGLLGTELAGATWMMTTQFTGCSFCYRSVGMNTYAAHITPAGITGKPATTGANLANQLIGNDANVVRGSFANFPGAVPALNIFGNGVGNANVVGGNPFYPPKTPAATGGQMKWMCIFGRHNGAWQIFSQSVDGIHAILEHRRIF